MLKNLKNRQQGFTIIEVMIVLVIAAVILLIVFLAVPALQRNSRNTQKKNVAANILSAASEYSSNNNGAALVNSISTTAGSDAAKILALVNTNQIITAFVIRAQNGAAPVALTNSILETNAKCAAGGTTVAGSSPRQVALLYAVEGANGVLTPACVEGGL